MRKILEFIFLTILAAASSLILGIMLKLAFAEPIALLILFPIYFGIIFIIIAYLVYTIDMLNELELGK